MRLPTVIITALLLYLIHEKQAQEYFNPTPTNTNTNNSTDLINLNANPRYNCHYSKLWCGCYSKSGGCQVGCSPATFQILYNQTSCPPLKSHFLSGFTTI